MGVFAAMMTCDHERSNVFGGLFEKRGYLRGSLLQRPVELARQEHLGELVDQAVETLAGFQRAAQPIQPRLDESRR